MNKKIGAGAAAALVLAGGYIWWQTEDAPAPAASGAAMVKVTVPESLSGPAQIGARAEEAGDTAGAACEVAEARQFTRAALASTRAAQLYKLDVLAADVQDTDDNVTYFAVLRRD